VVLRADGRPTASHPRATLIVAALLDQGE
jgi:hypothetical protein